MKKIKICGLKRIEDIHYVNEYQPDYVGFVFAKSKRQVTNEQAQMLKEALDKNITAVGVFIDAPIEQVVHLLKKETIDIVQLHGNEDATYIEALREQIKNEKKLIKAVRVSKNNDIEEAEQLDVDYLLLDACSPNGIGGTGEGFDWSMIGAIKKPYFLAGGIGLNNIEQALQTGAYAVDLSSSVETDGIKDKAKIENIMKQFRKGRKYL